MAVKIKICGLRRIQDIEYVNAVLPEYIGFVLTPGFRRSIDGNTAARLREKLDPAIKAVGVFVKDDAERINRLVRRGVIDMAQLHGGESAEFCKSINAPVIKYFNCAAGVPHGLENYDVAYYLFDSGTGTGRGFAWNNIPQTDEPFFLAGGLNESNVRLAVETVSPFAVDVSSAVETNGFKDFEKIKRFTEMARYE